MQQTKQLEEKIVEVLAANRFCSFGTVDGQKPKVRYMALFHEGLTIYLATNSKTDKVDELRSNPHVHVLVGYDGKKSSDILQIEAKAEICSEDSLRERLWNDSFKEWFEGPHDPDYVILKLTPERIEYNSAGEEVRVWQK
ncbi:pyridoxamine 5'-phosphate oxidase family protein [Paenibacillus puerhi]|uniref:pyridoxamine 5'-phosphate oxidase family protein n=1 Tax=Paenibacillus puerhi TaxID=2692622 RepID=UPI00135B7792|nr:pyridoxamine 5'-phosphate oxidase family protein [Paenibacillus puerhi]